MLMKKVVVSTLSEETFCDVVDLIEGLGVNIIEKRYDLLYHRYEIYAKLNLRQSYKLRHFVKSLDAYVIEFGA